MNVYLIRHAEAERISPLIKDSERTITAEGKKALENAIKFWKVAISQIDILLSSPYLRAKQTAEIVSENFGLTDKFFVDNKLAPGCKTKDIIELANMFKVEDIAFVGHQPDLSEHLEALISDQNINISFKPATIAKINFEGKVKPQRGTLKYLLPPKFFK